MSTWNFADVWETVATVQPDAPALTQGDRRLSWGEFDRRASGVAAALVEAGLGHQSKVALYLYNSPEYLETMFGAFKVGMVPLNTNYRYTDAELGYLWDNADAEAVVFHASFTETADVVRRQDSRVRVWIWVEDGTGSEPPSWAVRYEDAAALAPLADPSARTPDDLVLIYTGGTTGMPKGVMWRQDDLFAILNRTSDLRYPPDASIDEVEAVLRQPRRHPPARLLPGPPLMHGTGLLTALSALSTGGAIVLLQSHRLDVEELLATIETERVTQLTIVGDAFARPILAKLDEAPGKWDLSSLWLMLSSGVMWSAEVKAGLLRHHPRLLMVDTLGSSEAISLASSKTSSSELSNTASFMLGPDTKVITDVGTDVTPGSGAQGMVAIRGRGPVGYYKDPEKSAATFKMINGERWAVPGDFATVEADGSVRLLGRGSVCINTGGEKVFPEEVEEALKLHPAIADAVVVGVPHERFGETVTGVVELRPDVEPPSSASVIEAVKTRLAGYKAPRDLVFVDTIGRAPNGKVDYKRAKQIAIDALLST